MRIALIHYRLLRKGGLERRLLNYLTHFHQQGHEVTIFCAKKDHTIILPEGVKVVKINLGLMPKFFRKWYFDWKLKKVIKSYSFDFSLSLGRTSCQMMVLDPGNHLGYMEGLGVTRKLPLDYMQAHLDAISYQKSALVLAASQYVKNLNQKHYGTPTNKIKVLYPPLNIQQFNQQLRPQRTTLQSEFNIQPNKLTFLFISTGHKMKNLQFVLTIFENLVNEPFELLIAGSKPKRTLPNNVQYLGYVRQPERLYTAVDFTIHPARFEAFGQVIVESIQCGTPVIVSKNVGAKEFVSPKEGIIINSFQLEDWLEVVRGLKKNQFNIPPKFGERHQLTLEDHIQQMLYFWRELKS